MKKLHVHISVKDLKKSTAFYSKLFGSEPVKQKEDYVKWSLEDPKLNFAISKHCKTGLDHLGIEVEDSNELESLYRQADATNSRRDEEGEIICCYAHSEKSWITDPQGINWELFHTLNDEETFRGETFSTCCSNGHGSSACC